MSSDSFGARDTLEVARHASTRSTGSTRSSRRTTSPGCPTRSRSFWRTLCGSRTASRSRRTTSRRSPGWDAKAEPSEEIPFQPARVLMQDFTGVPGARRPGGDARRDGGARRRPDRIDPLVPVDLVIDHSVQVDAFGNARAFDINADRDYERNGERYGFLRWGQQAFDNLRVVPPATGICHQVNLEYLGQVVFRRERRRSDSGVPGHPRRHRLAHDDDQRARRARAGEWAASRPRPRCSGQPISMLLPQVVGFKLTGELPRGRDRDRPRAHRHRDASRARRRRQVRRVLRPGPAHASASPTGRRSGTCRRSSARPARSSRVDERDAPLPGVHRSAHGAGRAGRRLRPGAGDVPRPRTRRTPPSPRRWSSTSATSGRASPGPSARRTGSRSPRRRRRSWSRSRNSTPRPRRAWGTATTRRSPRASRPPTRRPRTTTAKPASPAAAGGTAVEERKADPRDA